LIYFHVKNIQFEVDQKWSQFFFIANRIKLPSGTKPTYKKSVIEKLIKKITILIVSRGIRVKISTEDTFFHPKKPERIPSKLPENHIGNETQYVAILYKLLFTYEYAYPQSLLLRSRLPHYSKLDYLVTRASSRHT
jgi:hypothetical protein